MHKEQGGGISNHQYALLERPIVHDFSGITHQQPSCFKKTSILLGNRNVISLAAK
jgi:hypothetical protein